ncbi:TetR/AcrR family transcriptional regulator [Nocardia sp. NPDC052001]|uniref:TetR/AcrR family transcriptional regulator n=1 Tax=Nocardia sp. NPDC052001 TaxID=3154853 RepID=UPI0034326C49
MSSPNAPVTPPAPIAPPDSTPGRIIDAAIAEFTEYGLRRVRLDDVAKRAGMHRVTVYKHFRNKDEVVRAAAITWATRFFTTIADAVAALPTREERIVEAFVLALQTIRTEPLIERGLHTEPEVFLPYLTVDGAMTIAAMREFFAAQLRAVPSAEPTGEDVDLDGAAELLARAGLSFLLTPESHFELRTDEQIRAFARRYFVPLLH